MLFNSIDFLIFLPIVFLLYWYVFPSRQLQNLFIVIASYTFYGWWDCRFLLLIAITSLFSYFSALVIERQSLRTGGGKIAAVFNIVFNLLILGFFKYYNFFVDNFENLLRSFGYVADLTTLEIILPVGISFYTFQALSYTIDVYHKKIKATNDIVEFFAYISFFPQLVAGPIERATSLLPQFQKNRIFDYAKAVDGMRQMLWGFFKKLVVADNCAFIVNREWDDYSNLSGLALLLLGILFTFQIYCDFSGYSDIAIGCARLFGINLRRNFNYPYFSRNIQEFWRRWHISLMTWFRDYVYIPLGGNRCGEWILIRNVLIVFFISGLWHGANWTYICWGLYHACIIIIGIIFHVKTIKENEVAPGRFFPKIKEIFQISITFTLVVFGWIIFRSESLTQLFEFIYSLCTNNFYDMRISASSLVYCMLGFLMLSIEWLQRDKQHAMQLPNNCIFGLRCVRWPLYVVMYTIIVTSVGQNQSFLYFQF